jgi:hypothetical protein
MFAGALITDLYDENGMLLQGQEMLAELERIFTTESGAAAGKKWYQGFTSSVDGGTLVDYDGMMEALGALNIPDSAKS